MLRCVLRYKLHIPVHHRMSAFNCIKCEMLIPLINPLRHFVCRLSLCVLVQMVSCVIYKTTSCNVTCLTVTLVLCTRQADRHHLSIRTMASTPHRSTQHKSTRIQNESIHRRLVMPIATCLYLCALLHLSSMDITDDI